jgi:hypothetical protein
VGLRLMAVATCLRLTTVADLRSMMLGSGLVLRTVVSSGAGVHDGGELQGQGRGWMSARGQQVVTAVSRVQRRR